MKDGDLALILQVFKNLCLNKYRIVLKDNSDETGQTEIDLSTMAEGGVTELLKRTLLTAINTVIHEKSAIEPKPVPLLTLTKPKPEAEVLPAEDKDKKKKMSVHGNAVMWDTITKTRQ